MDKQLPFDFDEPTCRKPGPRQPAGSEGIVRRANAANSHPAIARPPVRADSSFIHLLVGGVIVLQVAVTVAVLVLLAPARPQPARQEVVEALHIPSVTEAPPDLPPPRLFPDDGGLSASPTAEPPASDSTAQPSATLSEPASLRWRGLEVTQGIQVLHEPESSRCVPDPTQPDYIFCNNSMPLVSGRYTMVRVYPACDGHCPTSELTIRLRLLKDGQEQTSLTRTLPTQSLSQINTLSLPELRAKLENSVNFEFFPPPDWVVGPITFVVEVVSPDPAQALPAALTLTRDFAVRKPLQVAYLPIQYQGVTPPEPTDIEYWLLRMYPVPGVEYYRLPVPTLTWDNELSKSQILNKLLFTYWLYAQYQPVAAWPDQLFGWLPQEFFNGGVSDPFWCPYCAGPHSSRVAFGGLRPEQDIGGPRILVHEIAHNLGAQHAWSPTQQENVLCFKAAGADIQVDPAWPYADTPSIQEFGIDLYSNPPVIYPPAYYDMMAYCYQPWISPFTYRKLFDSPFLQPDAGAVLSLADFQPQAETSANGTLLVSGVVYPDGTVSQPEIIRLEGNGFNDAASGFSPPVFTPPAGDDYCLEIQATDGKSLARHCFDVGFADVETGHAAESAPFFFTLPNPAGQDIGQISVSKNNVTLVVTKPSPSPPEVVITYPNGGEVLTGRQTVTWNGFDADGDSLEYDLLYSADGGQSWLPLATRLSEPGYTFYVNQVPAGHNGLIRVIATDGFYTGTDDSDYPFTIEAASPNSISLRSVATVQVGQSFEVAVVANQVTGPGLYGVQFKLNFDPSLLRLDQVQLQPDLSLAAVKTIDNERGQVSIAASRQGQVGNLTGDLTLATLIFTAVSGNGQAYLELSEVKAGTSTGLPLTLSETPALSVNVLPK